MRAVVRLWGLTILLLALHARALLAQEEPGVQGKKNPVMQNTGIDRPHQDTIRTPLPAQQRPLPKFDLPEFIITGSASLDLPKLEKVMMNDPADVQKPAPISPEKILRDRETLELEMKRGDNDSLPRVTSYSGFAKASIGTFFTPDAEVQFGQSLHEDYYSLGGNYFRARRDMHNIRISPAAA